MSILANELIPDEAVLSNPKANITEAHIFENGGTICLCIKHAFCVLRFNVGAIDAWALIESVEDQSVKYAATFEEVVVKRDRVDTEICNLARVLNLNVPGSTIAALLMQQPEFHLIKFNCRALVLYIFTGLGEESVARNQLREYQVSTTLGNFLCKALLFNCCNPRRRPMSGQSHEPAKKGQAPPLYTEMRY